MQAVLGDIVIAQAPADKLISIEGNWYFPPDSVNSELLVKSATPYTCPWKGECQYFSVKDGDGLLQDRAWSYPEPYAELLQAGRPGLQRIRGVLERDQRHRLISLQHTRGRFLEIGSVAFSGMTFAAIDRGVRLSIDTLNLRSS